MDSSTYFNLQALLRQNIKSIVTLLVALSAIVWSRSRKHNLDHIPTVGSKWSILPFFGALRYLWDANRMVQEGYYKYQGSPFKIACLNRWVVVINGPQAIEEYRQVPDNDLSMLSLGSDEGIALKYTLGSNIISDQYHILVIRNQLTKNLGIVFPDIRDEIVQAFDEFIRPTANWAKVSAFDAVTHIVCRTSHRIFVGLPLLKDKSIIGRLLKHVDIQIHSGMRHLAPIIEERQRHMGKHGNEWEDKPNDLLSWLMDEASEVESSLRNLFLRVMTVNFGAVNSTSMTFTHALYHLAAMPDYIQPMRDEVVAVVSEEGWTKNAISKMYKVDSFLKETQRFNGIGSFSMHRRALNNFTLQDGTFIPKNTTVCAALFATHRDERNYANPNNFDGFRFVHTASWPLSEGENVNQKMVTTTATHLSFGYGLHSCPGRFFAAIELKAMMAHLVLNYDVKLENEGVRPPDIWLGGYCIPNQKADVLFRKRQA